MPKTKQNKSTSQRLPLRCQKRFVSMLPAIQQQAAHRLRNYPQHEQEELIAEVVALAFCMFATLAKRGRIDLAYPSPLAAYGCRQALAGRRAGASLNVNDVTSRHCQQRKRIRVERLDRFDTKRGEWREAVVADHRTPIPDQAAFRCDFPEWLKTLTRRQRRIAEVLASGEGTTKTAKRFRLSLGRISQMRRELHDGWCQFHGESASSPAMATA